MIHQALSAATARVFRPINLSSTDRLRVGLTREGDSFTCDVHAYKRDMMTWPSKAATVDFWNRVPEKKRLDGACCWQLPATDINALLLDAHWPRAQAQYTADARTLVDYLLATVAQQNLNAEAQAQYKIDKRLPVTALDLELSQDHPLAAYQTCALYCEHSNEGYSLLMEQGTGKTPIVIADVCNAARKLRATGEKRMYRAIVVCPNNVRTNWKNEFAKFASCPGKVTVFRGTEMARVKTLIDAFTPGSEDELFTVLICSYDILVRSLKLITSIDWDLCALDEAHYIKTSETHRCRAAMALRDKSKRRVPMTGTPITNSILDLYSILEFCYPGGSGFSSPKAFKGFYGRWETGESGYQRLVGVQNLPFMQERLARMAFITSKKEALPDLPDKVYDVVEVEMTKEQQEVYDKVATYLAFEIEQDLASGEHRQLTANNILVKLLRLAQITSGFVSWDPVLDDDGNVLQPKTVDRLDPNPKIDALLELARDKGPLDKTIVWACWQQDIKSIAAALELEGLKVVKFYGATSEKQKQEAERAFNEDDDCKWFVGNPAAGGVGLNLFGYPAGFPERSECNCNHEVYYSQNWSSVVRAQSEDRPHRRGTRCPVRITDLCAPETIDEVIRARVLEKRATALQISDIREILRNVFNRSF